MTVCRERYSLVLRAIVTEAYSQCDGNHQQWCSPAERIVGPHDALVEEHLDNEQVEVDSLDELPGKGTEEKIMEDCCDGCTDPIGAGHKGAVHPNQEDKLRETEGQSKLPVDVVEFPIQPARERRPSTSEGEGGNY